MDCHEQGATHSGVKVHVVGDDLNIRMEDAFLSNHLLQDVSNSSWEDQQRDLLLNQLVKKHFVAIPADIIKIEFLKENRNIWNLKV